MGTQGDGCEKMTEQCMKEFEDSRLERQEIKQTLDHINKRLFQSNGERAVVELIRDNKMEIARHIKETHRQDAVAPPANPQRDEPVRTRKIKMFKDIVSAENYSATDIIKISVAVTICVLLIAVIFKLFHIQSIMTPQ